MAKSTAVVSPNLGLRFDKPTIALDARELGDGLNFRIKDGSLNNLNLGWEQFGDFTLDGPVRAIINFFIRGGSEHLVFATDRDLYRWNEAGDVVLFISPVYVTGTAAASGTAVTGTTTAWDASNEVKAGDFISFGANDENDPAATWFEIATVGGDTSLTLTATAGTVANGPYTIRRTFTGSANDVWTYATFVRVGGTEDRLYLSNGIEPLIKWDGTDTFATSLDAFALSKIKAMAVYKNMMVYGNFEQGGTLKPTDIVNSDVGDPEDITTGLSEQFTVHSETYAITAIRALADNFVVYSERVVVIGQFVGDPLVFIFRTAALGVGAAAPRAIADFGDYHVFLSTDTAYRFDGVTIQEEGAHIWRDVIRRWDPFRRAISYAHFDEENGDLLWSIPLTGDAGSGDAEGSPERAFVLHYLETMDPVTAPMPYSQRELPFTAAGYYERQAGLTWDQISETWEQLNFRWNDQFFAAAFPLNLVGGTDGKVHILNASQNKDGGTALASFVRFGRKALADGRIRGLLRRIYPFTEQFNNALKVTARLMDHAMGPTTITHTEEFDQSLPEGGHFVSMFRRGRFLEPQFGTDGPSEPWSLAGFDIDVTRGGLR